MNTNKSGNGRRQFLRRLAGLAGVLSLAGLSGCGPKEEEKRTLPKDRLPPKPGEKRK